MMIAQNYRGQLQQSLPIIRNSSMNDNIINNIDNIGYINKCGLRDNNDLIIKLDTLFSSMFKFQSASITSQSIFTLDSTSINSFNIWLNTSIDNITAYNQSINIVSCCSCLGSYHSSLFGMRTDTPNVFATVSEDRTISPDIGIGLIPGRGTFLGGSVISITSRSLSMSLSAAYVALLIDTHYSYIHDLANAASCIPPYESAQSISPWNSNKYQVQRAQIKLAKPPEYPSNVLPTVTYIYIYEIRN